MESLEKQMNFLLEVDKLKSIYRQSFIASDNYRHENSAEHSWHVALASQVLFEYAGKDVDICRVMKMLLIHDIVEIEVGDTFAFADEPAIALQAEKEQQALDRLFGLLPNSQRNEMITLWQEFELGESADAKFSKCMDRIVPFLQNMANGGKSWIQHGIKKSQVLKRNQPLEHISPSLWRFICQQIEEAVSKGWLQDL